MYNTLISIAEGPGVHGKLVSIKTEPTDQKSSVPVGKTVAAEGEAPAAMAMHKVADAGEGLEVSSTTIRLGADGDAHEDTSSDDTEDGEVSKLAEKQAGQLQAVLSGLSQPALGPEASA